MRGIGDGGDLNWDSGDFVGGFLGFGVSCWRPYPTHLSAPVTLTLALSR